MKRSPEHRDEDLEFDTPKELLDDLSALCGAGVPVPPEVDEAIMAMARQRLAPRKRPRLMPRWAWAGATAAAAAILLAVWIGGTPERHRKATTDSAQTIEKEDFDGNGRVDILDAFALARHIESGRKANEKWDMNGDGTVDRTDINTIAMAAVSVKRGT
jgi:hypothetical protein